MKRKSQFKTLMSGVLVGLLALTTMVQAGQIPSVLSQMPSNAILYAATQPLGGINIKLNALAGEIGVVPQGESLNLLQMASGLLMQGFEVPVEINPAEGAGIVMLNPMQPEKSIAIYLPIKTPKQFIQSLPNKKDLSNGLWSIRGNMFMMVIGNHLVIAPKGEILLQIASGPKGIKPDTVTSEVFNNSDIAGNINLSSLMPMLRMGVMGSVLSEPEVQKYSSLTTIITQAVNRVCEIQSSAAGLSVGKAGVGLRLNIQAQPGSVLAQHLNNHPKAGMNKLTELPDGKFIGASTYSFNPTMFSAPLNAIAKAVANDSALSEYVDKADINKLQALITKSCNLPGIGSGASASYIAGSGGAMDMVQMAINDGDIDKSMQIAAEIYPLISQIIKKAADVDLPITFKLNAGSSQNYKYNTLMLDFSKLPIPMEAKQSIATMWGCQSGEPKLEIKMLRTGKHTMAVAMNSKNLDAAVKLAQSGGTLPISGDLATFKNMLPAQANSYGIMNIGNYVNMLQGQLMSNPQTAMIGGMMSAFTNGLEGSMAFSTVLENNSVKTQAALPTKLLKSGFKMVQQVQAMQSQGGGSF